MLPNIAKHSQQVKNVSVAIVDNLKEPASVNRQLVIACALLHDIAKTKSIETGEIRHDLMGGELMRALGFETIAVAVESHVILTNYRHEGPLEEREIVFYADKRVMHDRIVSVDERVDDLALRYGINDRIREMISENRKFIVLVENKIRSFMKSDMEAVISAL